MKQTASPALEIRALVKCYGGGRRRPAAEALRGVNLTVPRGAIYGLLGPNGAGKSTLINILAGLTAKTSGKLIVNGIDQDDDPRGTRHEIGVVPQEVVLDPFFSITETLEYYAGYFGVPKEKRRTREILEALSLADKAHLNSRRLSGGMKRRVLVAKALVHNPPILILDEPTAGVDVELRVQLWDYVRKLNRQGTTVLLTTHYLEEAEELCDRIAIINRGEIIADDTTAALKQRLDRKQITFRFAETLAEVPDVFAGAEASLQPPDRLTISYRPAQTGVDALISLTKQARLTIRDISTQEPDLEDIFRHLVRERAA